MSYRVRDAAGDFIKTFNNYEGATRFLQKRFTSIQNLEASSKLIVGGLAVVGLGFGMYMAGIPLSKWALPAAGLVVGGALAYGYNMYSNDPLMKKLMEPRYDVTAEEYAAAGWDESTPPLTRIDTPWGKEEQLP